MEKIKILQINKLYYPAIGGIERVVQYIAEGLKEKTEMSVLTCVPRGKGKREVIHGIPVHRCTTFGTLFSLPISLSFLFALRKEAKDKDILQFHAPFPLGDLACLLSGYRGKVVLYWHSDVVKQKKLMYLYRPIMERFLRRVDVIITSAYGNISGSSYLGPYKDKCVVIPFAVSKEVEARGKEYLLSAVPETERQTRFLFVGRLVYYKGVDVLLRAFERLSEGELTIIGSGPLEAELKEFVRAHDLEKRVHFLGQVSEEELYRQFAECDVFVLPSVAKSEAFGLVQLEAMAYGKPVINTWLSSGVPEVSLNGLTGITVKPGDAEELSQAMDRLAVDVQLRQRMGKAARTRLEQEFTFDVMMNRMMELYERLAR